MNTNLGSTVKQSNSGIVEMPELISMLDSLNIQLERSKKISCLFYDKLDKLKANEPTKSAIEEDKLSDNTYVERLYSIIEGFRTSNNRLNGSLAKLEKLIG